jgi:mono/diheme cytochrome c family protein
MRIYLLALMMLICLPAFATNVRVEQRERSASQLYRRYCADCHGSDGKAKTSKGKFSHARDLTNPQWHADVTDERIFNSIMNGRDVSGNMPAFSDKLKEKEVNSLVTLVRKFKEQPQQ